MSCTTVTHATMTTGDIPAGTHRPVWRNGLRRGTLAAVAVEGYGLLARAVGIPMRAGNIGADHADPMTTGMFAMETLICTALGTILAVALARWAKTPRRSFIGASSVLTTVSLAAPVLAGDTAASIKATLAIAHLLVAAIVIPALAGAVPAIDPQRSN